MIVWATAIHSCRITINPLIAIRNILCLPDKITEFLVHEEYTTGFQSIVAEKLGYVKVLQEYNALDSFGPQDLKIYQKTLEKQLERLPKAMTVFVGHLELDLDEVKEKIVESSAHEP